MGWNPDELRAQLGRLRGELQNMEDRREKAEARAGRYRFALVAIAHWEPGRVAAGEIARGVLARVDAGLL